MMVDQKLCQQNLRFCYLLLVILMQLLLLLLPRRIGLGQRHLPLLLDVLLDRRADGARAGGAPLVVLQELPRSHAPAQMVRCHATRLTVPTTVSDSSLGESLRSGKRAPMHSINAP